MAGFLASVPGKLNNLLNRLTEARANNLDNCNAPISDCAKTSDTRFNHLDLDISKSLAVLRVEEFFSTTSFTIPSDVYLLMVELLVGGGGGGGGGAGGGDNNTFGDGGGGGGGAETIFQYPIRVSPGDTIQVVIGSGGAGGTGGNPTQDGTDGWYGGVSYIKRNGVAVVGALGGAPGHGGIYHHTQYVQVKGGQPRAYYNFEFNVPGTAGGDGGNATNHYAATSGGTLLYPYWGGVAGSPHSDRGGGGGGSTIRGRGGGGGDGASDSDNKPADPGANGQGPGAGGGGGGGGTSSSTSAYKYGKDGGDGHGGYALISFLGAKS